MTQREKLGQTPPCQEVSLGCREVLLIQGERLKLWDLCGIGHGRDSDVGQNGHLSFSCLVLSRSYFGSGLAFFFYAEINRPANSK